MEHRCIKPNHSFRLLRCLETTTNQHRTRLTRLLRLRITVQNHFIQGTLKRGVSDSSTRRLRLRSICSYALRIAVHRPEIRCRYVIGTRRNSINEAESHPLFDARIAVHRNFIGHLLFYARIAVQRPVIKPLPIASCCRPRC